MLLSQVLACLLDVYVYLCMYGVYLGGKGGVINMNTLDDLDQHFEVYNRLTFWTKNKVEFIRENCKLC